MCRLLLQRSPMLSWYVDSQMVEMFGGLTHVLLPYVHYIYLLYVPFKDDTLDSLKNLNFV